MSECRSKKTASSNTWWIIGIVVLVVLVLGFFCCNSFCGRSNPCGGCSNPCRRQGCQVCGNCQPRCCNESPCGQSSCNNQCCRRSSNSCCEESPCKRSSCDRCCSPKDRAWKCLTRKLDQYNSCVGEAAGVPDQLAQCKSSFVSDTSCDCGYTDKGCLMLSLQNYQACVLANPSTGTATNTNVVTCKTVFQREVEACMNC